jgi:hypothetical protein
MVLPSCTFVAFVVKNLYLTLSSYSWNAPELDRSILHAQNEIRAVC